MTTHVFIVDKTTFPLHLQYLFAGTGAKEKDVDFNGNPTSALYPSRKHAAEAGLVSMMADCSRIRSGDYIIFYLQASSAQEGRFYGVFQADGEPFLDRATNTQFLADQLGKNLTFRIKIKPYEVYAKGVTEWKALDEIRNIQSPCQMLWSLIYRKLKGNRGNTMITIYETERLVDLIRCENGNTPLPPSQYYDYNPVSAEIISSSTSYNYTGATVPFDILPRMIKKDADGLAYESHLQMYIVQNIGRNTNPSLDQAAGIAGNSLEWIGNEVSCGVGMQRIDIMLSMKIDDLHRRIVPIELKSVPAYSDNIRQIERYIDWIEQYYIPNRMSTIQPVLICKAGGLTSDIRTLFHSFNTRNKGRCLPLGYIEYSIGNQTITFSNVPY